MTHSCLLHHCSILFSCLLFTYFILHYKLALNTRSMVYKGALDRYPSFQASSPLLSCSFDPLAPLLCTLVPAIQLVYLPKVLD